MTSNDVAIKVEAVSKSFKLPHENINSLKGSIINFWRHKRSYETQNVLQDIWFEVKKGEFFGVVGRNGSGKSTLLKLIAQIYTPDKGRVIVNGKLTPFIELGVGFNGELSGRENVYLNGALLGFSHTEMDAMYKDIVEFAELERFMDQKLKNYSSGMQVRLAFSIAIRANAEILVLDEVLAVGDEAFQRKCFDYFSKLKEQNKTVILVTHDMGAVQRFCKRAILLDGGRIVCEGSPKLVAARYSELNLGQSSQQQPTSNQSKRMGDGSARLTFSLLDASGKKRSSFAPNEEMIIRARVKIRKPLKDPRLGVVIQDAEGRFVFATNTRVMGVQVGELEPGKEYNVDFRLRNIFTDGSYSVSGAAASNYDEVIYDRIEDAVGFDTGGWDMKHAIVHPEHQIIISDVNDSK